MSNVPAFVKAHERSESLRIAKLERQHTCGGIVTSWIGLAGRSTSGVGQKLLALTSLKPEFPLPLKAPRNTAEHAGATICEGPENPDGWPILILKMKNPALMPGISI
jgi:hypothetical protein